jgi:hypothetical protein
LYQRGNSECQLPPIHHHAAVVAVAVVVVASHVVVSTYFVETYDDYDEIYLAFYFGRVFYSGNLIRTNGAYLDEANQ